MTVACRHCLAVVEIDVTPAQVTAWQAGGLIQRVMPELTPNEREMLMTGTCGHCWRRMFGDPEDDE